MTARRDLPRGLPAGFEDAAHTWLDGLVSRGILYGRPASALMSVRTMGANRVAAYVLDEDSDFYARAVLAPSSLTDEAGRVVEESWGNLEPVHNSEADYCLCHECEEGRADG